MTAEPAPPPPLSSSAAVITRPSLAAIALRPTAVTRIALFPLFAIPAAFAFAAASTVALAAFVAAYAVVCTAIARRRMIVDDDGVELRGVSGRRRLRWDELAYYTYWSSLVELARWRADTMTEDRVLDSPAASVTRVRHRLVLHATTGKRLVIDSSFYAGAQVAIGRVLDEVHRQASSRRRTADFAPYAITDDGLKRSAATCCHGRSSRR